MNPKRFLTLGGTILVTLGFLGVVHLLGRISGASLFNPPYWINWFHLSLGIFLLVTVLARFARLWAGLTLFGATIGTTIGLLGLLLGRWAASRYNIPELADPSDHLAHLTVGLVALWAWRNRGGNTPSDAAKSPRPAA